MSDDQSILIKDETTDIKKKTSTIDSILDTKVLITTLSAVSGFVFVFSMFVLGLFDVWLILVILRVTGKITTPYILINIPLMVISLGIFHRLIYAKRTVY